MENKIIHITSNEFKLVQKILARNDQVFLAEIEGKGIATLSEYFLAISDLCHFPIPARSWDGYEDWMTDLTWIDKKNIVIVIKNFQNFMHSETSSKNKVIKNFQNSIIPWWERDVMKYVVHGEFKTFKVYLVD